MERAEGLAHGIRTCYPSRGLETCRGLGSLLLFLRLGKALGFCRGQQAAPEWNGGRLSTTCFLFPQRLNCFLRRWLYSADAL